MHRLAKLDQRYVWHPFTQMRDWVQSEPTVIVAGKGAVLVDAYGREYLDANSSIWTNLHGHNHPRLNAAIARQLKRIAHSSALGLANEPASLLAEQLIRAANPVWLTKTGRSPDRGVPAGRSEEAGPASHLMKVFFSDDGSTAMEVALKLAYAYARRTGRSRKPRFLSLSGAYHGDTLGAVALGHIDLFHRSYAGLLFPTDQVMAPYCYRCRFNRARPERSDARNYRKCNWECLDKVQQKFEQQKKRGNPYAGFVFEPLIQGAAGMSPQPAGWLKRAAEIARGHKTLLIADEVLTGFGRTGIGGRNVKGDCSTGSSGANPVTSASVQPLDSFSLFACHHESVQPDFMALAKGMTGGYLPMAATLTSQPVFDAFLGRYEEFKTFFHGHSFTGNQLGAAAALTSLELLHQPSSIRTRLALEIQMQDELQNLWSLAGVGDIRQVGLVAGVELVKNWHTREPFDLRERVGIRVCEAMARRGVLTRPIGNVIVLIPPYCTTPKQLRRMVTVLGDAIAEVMPAPSAQSNKSAISS